MSSPIFKTLLNNSVKGEVDVSSSTFGYEDFKLKLERHPDFHSLVEIVETPLIFRGSSKDYILDVLDSQGPDSICDVVIELSYDQGINYEQIFSGLIRLEMVERVYAGTEIKEIKAPIIQNEFWQKFINRRDTSVKIGDGTSVDGDDLTSVTKHVLNMPSQTIKKTTDIRGNDADSLNYTQTEGSLSTSYFLDFSNVLLDEIEQRYTYPFQIGDTVIEEKFMFVCKEAGSYDIDITLNVDVLVSNDTNNIGAYNVRYVMLQQDPGGSPSGTDLIQVTGTEPTLLTDTYTLDDTYTDTLTVEAGTVLWFYGLLEFTSAKTVDITINDNTYINIIANTTKTATTAETFKIHETAESITDQIIGQNGSFYSERLGNTSTEKQSYVSNGDMSYKALTKGINIRGKLFASKPMYMSFNEWWEGINPIVNLGLGYEDISSKTYIRCEEREHFYQDTPSLQLSNIDNLIRVEDDKLYIKSVEIGYKKWKAEELGLLDDPQSKHKYYDRFKTFGKDHKILSRFYAASIGIEQARRRSILETEDFKLDDDIIIIELDRTSQSNPDLVDDFGTITGLNNSSTRYNIKLTPKRALLRNFNWLNVGLIQYTTEKWYFGGGEGNYDMVSDLNSSERGDYNNNPIGEGVDIRWDYNGPTFDDDTRPIMKPVIWKFEDQPLKKSEWDTLVANRKKSIEISTTNIDHFSVFMEVVEWSPYKGKANFETHEAY